MADIERHSSNVRRPTPQEVTIEGAATVTRNGAIMLLPGAPDTVVTLHPFDPTYKLKFHGLTMDTSLNPVKEEGTVAIPIIVTRTVLGTDYRFVGGLDVNSIGTRCDGRKLNTGIDHRNICITGVMDRETASQGAAAGIAAPLLGAPLANQAAIDAAIAGSQPVSRTWFLSDDKGTLISVTDKLRIRFGAADTPTEFPVFLNIAVSVVRA
jgi:hypothetical protein